MLIKTLSRKNYHKIGLTALGYLGRLPLEHKSLCLVIIIIIIIGINSVGQTHKSPELPISQLDEKIQINLRIKIDDDVVLTSTDLFSVQKTSKSRRINFSGFRQKNFFFCFLCFLWTVSIQMSRCRYRSYVSMYNSEEKKLSLNLGGSA